MTCRHEKGDPNCSSSSSYRSSYEEARSVTPDAANYTIERVDRVGRHLVMKVKYPNCQRCAFEGLKVMVFLDVTELQALRWRRIDPHFRAGKAFGDTEAPSPAARFPGTESGWHDAMDYARRKGL